MAVQEEAKTVRVALKLNDGQTQTGKVKTVTVGLGNLSVVRYASNEGNAKAVAIVNALTPCLERSLYAIDKTAISELYEN